MKKHKIKQLDRLPIFISIGFLGLIGLALVCPSTNITHAEDLTTTSNAETITRVVARPTISVALDPIVTIDIIPKSSGTYSSATANLSVATNSRNGFAVLMNGVNGTALQSSSNPASKISTITKNSTLANLPANTWGYYIGEQAPNDNSEFSGIPATSSEIKSTNTSTATQTYKIAFGTKIDANLEAGTYSNSILISVVANPVEVIGLQDLYYMQDITSEICNAATTWKSVDDEAQLVDARDGRKYWVSKLADGKCWMQQNLALELVLDDAGNAAAKALDGQNITLTKDNTDLSTATWNSSTGYAPVERLTTPPSNPTNTPTGNAYSSISSNNIILANPTGNSDCGRLSPSTSLLNLTSTCSSQLKAVSANMKDTFHATNTSSYDAATNTYDSHYLIGNWYSLPAATAGTLKSTSNGKDAPDSICPKGWRLPTNSEQIALLTAYGANTTTNNGLVKIATKPIYSVRSGYTDPFNSAVFSIGSEGDYYSSTIKTQGYGYVYNFNSNITLTKDFNSQYGTPIRCIAK